MNNFLMRRLIGCGVAIAILAVIGIGVAVYMGVVSMMHANYAAPFKPQMAAYVAAPTGSNMGDPVKGKIIVLDKGKQDFDWDVSYDLPADLKASKPEEVGAVVLTDWQKNEVGTYDDGTRAYQYTVDVTVVDHARRTVIAQSTFTGSEPPRTIKYSSEGVGSKPTKEVVDYLKGLPRQ
jgi:hypothetical protein